LVVRVKLSYPVRNESRNRSSLCGEGHCFGEYSALSGNPNPYTVVANEDTVILQIPEQDIHNYLAMNPKNSMEVIKSMSRQIAVATKHIELLTQE
jgi:CRP-like cAMP-binding protein